MCIYTYIYMYVYECIRIYIYTCIYVYTTTTTTTTSNNNTTTTNNNDNNPGCYVFIHMYIYIYIYIYTYIYIYIYIWQKPAVVTPFLAYVMLKKMFSPARDAPFQKLCWFITGKHHFWTQTFSLGHIHVVKFMRCFAMAKQHFQHAHVNQKGSMGNQGP